MASTVRLSEALDAYLTHCQTRHASATFINESFVLRRFEAWYGDVQMRNLRAERVEEWFNSLLVPHTTRDGQRREPIQASTFNHYLARLKGFFGWCAARSLVKGDPLLQVEPRRTVRERRQQPSAALLVQMVEGTTNARDRAFLATSANTAARSSELRGLRVADVDLDGGYLHMTITKSGTTNEAPITSDLDLELRRWLAAYAQALGRPLTGEDFLFPAKTGSHYEWSRRPDGTFAKGRKPSTWRPDRPATHSERIVKGALARVGLPTKHEGCHTFRRAAARHFFDVLNADLGRDGALRTVSAMLCHKNASTTEVYLGLSRETERRDERLKGRSFLTA